MPISNEELLQKANLTTTDFGGVGEAPLSVEQVDTFIELMANEQVVLPDVRTVTSTSPKWQESIIDFNSRILRPGVELTRLGTTDRTKPSTGVIEINTVLQRGEVPVSDETMEDNVARDRLANSLEKLIADRVGFDVEDLFINGDVGSGDTYLAQLDGWVKQAQGPNGNVYDATNDGQDYQLVFKSLLNRLPNRFKRNLRSEGRFYVPSILEERYRDILANRGTALGDLLLTTDNELKYQGIVLKGSPTWGITAGTPDKSSILLSHRQNLYAGYQRKITLETFRDPREGGTSFVVTCRVDAKIAVPNATAVATNVDVEP